MAKKLDQIIVVDVEATCWEGEPPPDQKNEIIEIGICTVEVETAQRLEQLDLLVKPQESAVSEYCTRLTTLTQEEVDRGISFEEACDILKQKFRTKERAWASYGDYDRNQFTRQCERRNVKYPFGPTHFNVKSLFAIVHRLKDEVGMAKALELMGMPLEGTHHRAGDDAWNIAGILCNMLRRARDGKPS